MLLRAIFLILPLLIFASSALAEQHPPAGWRYPNKKDMTGDWLAHKKKLKEPYHIKADFDGDGLTDDAWILLKRDGSGWGLYAFIKRKKAPIEVFPLADSPIEQDVSDPQAYSISIAKPGRYQTADGPVDLVRPGIDFFRYGGVEWVYYWSSPAGSFKAAAISE